MNKKILSLPSVVDLGWSETEALPMRSFQPDVQGYTWEDYHEKMKQEYPVLYFLNMTLPRFVAVKFVMPLRELKYYVQDHLIRRTHLLDLRQSSTTIGCDDYRGGYLDPRQAILYACMNSLGRFLKESDAENHLAWMERKLTELPADSTDRKIFEDNCALYREALNIDYWWSMARKIDFEQLSTEQSNARTEEEKRAVYKKWDAFELWEDKMLHRLINIRMSLWN